MTIVVNSVGVHTHTNITSLIGEEYGEAHGGWTACHEGHSHIHDGAEVLSMGGEECCYINWGVAMGTSMCRVSSITYIFLARYN